MSKIKLVFLVTAIMFSFFFTNNESYSQTPCTVWQKLYNGPANLQDSAVGMSVNGSGFVFVTGWSLTASGADIVTIRYNPATGDTLWVKRFNGGTNNEDKPTAIYSDGSSVYVTGWSFNLTNRNVVILKYDIASGNEVWNRTYNGTGNGGDYGFSIVSDAAGNVYVAGRSDIGGAQKYLILKYDSAGNPVAPFPFNYTGPLSSTFDQANSIKLDAAGNIYVTGKSGLAGAENFLTLKVSSAAVTTWAKLYNGNQNNDDNAAVVLVDNTATHVYACGTGYRTGLQQNFVVIRYSAATGDSTAFATYDGGTASSDILSSAAIDNSGNVYITGISNTVITLDDYATIKYNAGLSQQWVSRTSGSLNERPTSLSVDGSGFVYVTGSAFAGGNYDYLTVGYRTDGSLFWSKMETGTGGANDYASYVVATDSQSVYVTGSANFSSTGIAYFTLRYTSCTGIEPVSGNVPSSFALMQNYPNPFNPVTTIRFDIAKSTFVKISVFDITGREVEVLASENVKPGEYEVKWNAAKYSSGVYFYSIVTDNFVDTKKMILTK